MAITSTENIDDDQVFEWLGTDPDGTPYHLLPLNLVWSSAGVDRDLEIYRRVAQRVAEHPQYWSALILNANWRHTLVGCACLLVLNHSFGDGELCRRFKGGSIVAPQIAVTLGLLHPEVAIRFLDSFLRSRSVSKDARRVISADYVLKRLRPTGRKRLIVERMRRVDPEVSQLTARVAQQHWEFWSERLSLAAGAEREL